MYCIMTGTKSIESMESMESKKSKKSKKCKEGIDSMKGREGKDGMNSSKGKTGVSFFYILFFVAFAQLLASCKAVTTDSPEIAVQKKTVLFYMAANNNLSGNIISNINSIRNSKLPSDDNLVIYSHLSGKNPVLIRVSPNGGETAVDTLYKFPSATVSANSTTLKNVLSIVQTLCPAEKYGLVLSSHGTGWLPSGFYSNPTGYPSSSVAAMSLNAPDPYAHMVKSFGSETDADGTSLVEMEITDMAKAIPYKLEFILFDVCLMSNIEVLYELKDVTDYFIASPAEVLASGFPYTDIVGYMYEDVVNAKGIAEAYYNHYNRQSGAYRSATIGAFKTDGLNDVAAAAKTIFEKKRDNILSLNRSSIQRYYRLNKHWFYDFENYMEVLSGGGEDFTALKQALDKVTIYKNATENFINIKIERTCGISSYITEENTVLTAAYKKLAWNKDVQMIAD